MKAWKKRYCKRCGSLVRKETSKPLRQEYPFYCPNCDENMFRFETTKNKNGKNIKTV